MEKPALKHFETFLCVANSGGFTAAAKVLGISKAAVSNTIRLLEESLKVPLFIRTTRRIRLTEEGELLFIQCERLQHELDTARDLVSGFSESPSGNLKISCNLNYSENWLADILLAYGRKFPDVSLEIMSEERMPDMSKEQVDIVFGVNWKAPLDVVARPIGKTRYVICASPAYIKKHGAPSSIKDIENHCYIPHAGRGSNCLLTNLKQPETLNINPHLKADNAGFMKVCALKGMGIIQLHDYMVQEELDNGELVEILSEFAGPDLPIYVYYQKHRFVQPKIRQFINFVVKDLSEK